MHRTFVLHLTLMLLAALGLLSPTAANAQSLNQRQWAQQQAAQRWALQQQLAQRQLYLQHLAAQRRLYLQQLAQRQLYLQRLAAQQQLAAQGQAASAQATQQEAAEQRYRQQLVQQQQRIYEQLYRKQMSDRPLTREERQHQAIAKILAAVFVKAAGKAAEGSDNNVIAILAPVVADRISNALIESAVADLFPDLPPVGVRAVARAARLSRRGR